MSGWNPRANEIFLKAVEYSTLEGCRTFIDRACAGDDALRAEVEDLLQAHSAAGSFLAAPAVARTIDMPAETPIAASPGTVIGPYKLLQQIGEGGMGVVYMAEQAAPVRRKVALKIIKPGMDSREVIARFEAERQALALMDHPNIARVFDGGATEAGRPYFVMELVRGVPITDYCDQNNLPVHERLELFVTVCHAVQHAHQKGIIHRDIKPSNVLVTMHDGQPVPKVIDFGVAKAIGQQLTDKTLFTQFAQMIGTPLYMSPEQAELTGQDIDTRGDIYSLGVLLYELLTGTTPFDSARMKKVALEEIRRMIREEDPPSPSTRLSSTAGETQTAVAAHRHIDPKGLSRLVRGDLDWIVMKALEKDRTRRYETANGFAADIGRYLSDEPVEACPPSSVYRFRKFARRNRGLVMASMVVLAALVMGIAGTTTGLLQAQAERDKVLAAQEKERLALIEAEENFQTARGAVDKMYTRAAEEMRDKPQVEQIRRGLLEDALRFYQGFLKKKSTDPAIRYESALSQRRVGEIYGLLGNLTESLENHREAVSALVELRPRFADDVSFRDELARAHFHTGYTQLALKKFDEGAASQEEAMALWEPLTEEFPDQPSYLEDLARAHYSLGLAWQKEYDPREKQQVTLGQGLLARLKQRFPDHQINPGFQTDLDSLVAWRYAALPHDAATLKQLEQECRDQLAAAEAQSRKYPDAPQYENQVVEWLGRMGNILAAMDRLEELEQLGKRKMEIRTRLAAQHPDNPEYQKNLAWEHNHRGELLYSTNRPDEGLDEFRKGIALASDIVDKYPQNLRALTHLAAMLRGCPAAQIRDPQRVLSLALRMKELGQVEWGLALAQIDGGQYREALETCEKLSRAGQQSGVVAYATAIAYWHSGRQAEARDLARQVIQQIGSQANQYWYVPEYLWRIRELVKLMGLESEDLTTSDPEKVLRNGIALYHKLAAERPGDPGMLQELARRYTELSLLLSGSGRNEEAEQTIRQAVAEWEKLVAESPGNDDYRMRLGNTLWKLADVSGTAGHHDEAEKALRRALDVFEKLAADFPNQDRFTTDLARNQAQLIVLLRKTGRSDDVEKLYRQAIARCEKLAAANLNVSNFQTELARNHNRLGILLRNAGKAPEAESELRKAQELWRANSGPELQRLKKAAEADSKNGFRWRDLAVAYCRFGNWEGSLEVFKAKEHLAGISGSAWQWFYMAMVHWQLDHKDEARSLYYQSIDWVEKSQEKRLRAVQAEAAALMDLPDPAERCEQAWAYRRTGAAFEEQGQKDEAKEAYSKAIDLYEKLAVDFPAVPVYRTTLVDLLNRTGRGNEVERVVREVISHYEKLGEANPQSLWATRELAELLRSAGPVPEALPLWEKLVAESPGNDDLRMHFGHALWQLADRSSVAGRHDEAEKTFRRALKVFEKLAADFPGNPFYRAEQGFSHWKLGWLMNGLGHPQEAEEPFREALAVYKQLALDEPKNLEFQLRLSRGYNELAPVLARQGKHADAAVEWDNAATEYTKAIALKLDDWQGWSGRAFVHFHRRQWDEAVADFSKSIELDPQVHANWWHRAHAYCALAQWDKAAADFGTAVERWPGGTEGWYWRSICFIRMDQPEKALADLRQVIAKGFRNVEQIKNDPHFDALRTREDFGKLLEEFSRK